MAMPWELSRIRTVYLKCKFAYISGMAPLFRFVLLLGSVCAMAMNDRSCSTGRDAGRIAEIKIDNCRLCYYGYCRAMSF